MISQSVIDDLQRSAFEAAAGPGAWSTFVRQVADRFGASSAYLRSSSPHDQGSFWVDTGVDDSAKQAYLSHWGAQDPWAAHPRGHAISRSGRCFIGSHIVPTRDLGRTAFHADFGRRVGLTHVMSAMVEDGSRGPQTKLALFREDGRDDFTEEQLRAFEALQPALRCALQSHWFLSGMAAHRSGMEGTLDALPSAVFVLTASGRVLFCNDRARELPPGMVRLRLGELRGVGPVDTGELHAALRMTSAGMPQALPFWVAEGDGVRTGTLHLSRLQAGSFTGGEAWPGAEILAVIRLDNRDAIRRARTRAVVQCYRLTGAEEKVLNALARGLTPQEAAAELAVSMNTMRTHVRHLLQKVRGRRIGDVLNLL